MAEPSFDATDAAAPLHVPKIDTNRFLAYVYPFIRIHGWTVLARSKLGSNMSSFVGSRRGSRPWQHAILGPLASCVLSGCDSRRDR